ncbi:MAG: hypothetical protein ACOCP8_05395 [archaeon]
MNINYENIEKVKEKMRKFEKQFDKEEIDSIKDFFEISDKDKKWIKEEIKKNCHKYVGKNIAVFDRKILGISENFSELFTKLREIENFDVFYVLIVKVYNNEEEWKEEEEKLGVSIHGITLEELDLKN